MTSPPAALAKQHKCLMSYRPFNVLFLCTGNSARSILAEQLVNHWGRGKFRGFSAGSHPKGQVHPIAFELLKHMKLPTEGLRSKNWDEFAAAGAPPLDFVFTVCDNAAGEVCPVWPGQPMMAITGESEIARARSSCYAYPEDVADMAIITVAPRAA